MAKPLELRERKKLAAMSRLQATALDLFDQHGYDAVTIERIADAADVSPSSVYRYFGTKEQLVLYDEYDPLMIDTLEQADPSARPLAVVRDVLGAAVQQMDAEDEHHIRRRLKYSYTVPAVNAAMVQEALETEKVIRAAFSRQTGMNPADFELQVFASSIVAAFLTALRYWYDHEGELTLFGAIERALDVIEHDLDGPPSTTGDGPQASSGTGSPTAM